MKRNAADGLFTKPSIFPHNSLCRANLCTNATSDAISHNGGNLAILLYGGTSEFGNTEPTAIALVRIYPVMGER